MDITEIAQVLGSNNGKDFVKRIIFPDNAPKLDLGDGEVATHRMAWAEADGKYYVFPTVMRNDKGGLTDYGKNAFDEALRRREFITFDDPEKAAQFSEQYKDYWKTIGYEP